MFKHHFSAYLIQLITVSALNVINTYCVTDLLCQLERKAWKTKLPTMFRLVGQSTSIVLIVCAIYMLANGCKGLKFIDLPSDSDEAASMESVNIDPKKSSTALPSNHPDTDIKKSITTEPKESSTASTASFSGNLTTTKSEGFERKDFSPISLSDDHVAIQSEKTEPKESSPASMPIVSSTLQIFTNTGRRFAPIMRQRDEGDDTDEDILLKKKIAVIIQQTVHDTTKKVASVQKVKERVRDQAPYKAGYILSLVRKSRLMLNDLFNLAVKHRDNWKALQQLKVFEYIVHTNVDTTNLVRQLVEVHIQHLNSTQSIKKRVVLI